MRIKEKILELHTKLEAAYRVYVGKNFETTDLLEALFVAKELKRMVDGDESRK